jgi:hypothetical protein
LLPDADDEIEQIDEVATDIATVRPEVADPVTVYAVPPTTALEGAVLENDTVCDAVPTLTEVVPAPVKEL